MSLPAPSCLFFAVGMKYEDCTPMAKYVRDAISVIDVLRENGLPRILFYGFSRLS